MCKSRQVIVRMFNAFLNEVPLGSGWAIISIDSYEILEMTIIGNDGQELLQDYFCLSPFMDSIVTITETIQ